MIRMRRLAGVLFLAALASCGGREVLEPYPAGSDRSANFAGTWELRGDRALIERHIASAIRQTDGVRDTARLMPPDGRGGGRPGNGRVKGGIVHVFFENGERLQITQTETGLFVSFDRAVVEEYRFGENREIRVGQATAQRVSGWDGADYVIETLDRNGMKLTERYQLANDGKALTRRVAFRAKNGDVVPVTMMYRRR